jgi:hypothetical protein
MVTMQLTCRCDVKFQICQNKGIKLNSRYTTVIRVMNILNVQNHLCSRVGTNESQTLGIESSKKDLSLTLTEVSNFENFSELLLLSTVAYKLLSPSES